MERKSSASAFTRLTSLLYRQAVAYTLARADNQAFRFSHSAAASPMVFGVPSRIQAIKDLSKRNAGPQASRIKRRTFWVLRYPALTGVCGVITSRCQSKAESSRVLPFTLMPSQSSSWERPKGVPKGHANARATRQSPQNWPPLPPHGAVTPPHWPGSYHRGSPSPRR